MSLEKTVASKPSNGSAKVVPIESEEMVAFGNIYLREEDFSLSVVLGFGPLKVPRFEAVLFTDLFDMGEGYGGGKKVWICGGGMRGMRSKVPCLAR